MKKLKDLMKLKNIDGYIIPSKDSHNSEYIANHHKRREFISS
jgi:Xaa-Pro aminopeptidase